jgi:hypothetical protein
MIAPAISATVVGPVASCTAPAGSVKSVPISAAEVTHCWPRHDQPYW